MWSLVKVFNVPHYSYFHSLICCHLFRGVHPIGPDRHQCWLWDWGRSSLPGVSTGHLTRNRRTLTLLGHVAGPAGEGRLWDCGHSGGNGGSYWWGMALRWYIVANSLSLSLTVCCALWFKIVKKKNTEVSETTVVQSKYCFHILLWHVTVICQLQKQFPLYSWEKANASAAKWEKNNIEQMHIRISGQSSCLQQVSDPLCIGIIPISLIK